MTTDQTVTNVVPETRIRPGDWMMVYSGRRFWPMDPRPEDVTIEDIAHALSMICRYQGHSSRFYSVAEHSLLMSEAARRYGLSQAEQLQALMHDAAEAYVCDLVRPLKRSLGPEYGDIERGVERAIQKRFGLLAAGKTPAIDELDNLILYDEAKALMRVDMEPWHERHEPGLDVTIHGLMPFQAEERFLEAFHKLATP